MAQLLLGAPLRRVTACEGIGHGVERGPEVADLRSGMPHPDACVVVAVAPLRGHMEQAPDRFLKERAPTHDRSQGRREETESNQCDATRCRGVDCRECFGFRLAGAEKEVPRRQRRRHISENSGGTIDADRLFPSGCVSVHDAFMALPHIFSDQCFGIWQSGDDVALAIGNQDRRCRR